MSNDEVSRIKKMLDPAANIRSGALFSIFTSGNLLTCRKIGTSPGK